MDGLGVARIWNAQARRLHAEGRTAEALEPARAALALVQRVRGARHGDTTNVRLGLSIICERLSLYDEAEEQAERSVTATDHDDAPVRLRAHALSRLAALSRIRGRLAHAEILYQHAMALSTADDTDRVSLLTGLGVVYKATKEYDAAERLYRKAMGMTNPHGAAAASLWHNLGGLDHARGRYAAGEPAARRSVRIRSRLLGVKHPTVAADKAALASLLVGQGKFDEAEDLYLTALLIFSDAYGMDNYEMAVTHNDLGALAAARGNPELARRHYTQAIAIKTKILGANHREVALTQRNNRLLDGGSE
ncbi:tetratricopeptide repeat protein [Fodinicola feengrottensis]|uniref:Tetratricopeptide repeat protein n=1 Tax=Fodinicola feengrottensis TaxID=435914 RepID=A0ABN2GKY6_9ACTN|nr:tetratricopeptide repeat protein [Fodinicola feengrottensis]